MPLQDQITLNRFLNELVIVDDTKAITITRSFNEWLAILDALRDVGAQSVGENNV